MGRPALMVGAAATLSVALLAGSTGVAAGVTTPPTPTLPTVTVTVPPLPLPTPSVSLPAPVPTPTVSVPPVGGGGGGGGGSQPTGEPTAGTATAAAAQSAEATSATAGTGKRKKPASNVTPMVASQPGVVLDEESTPALDRASKAFLVADTKIAALTDARSAMLAARDGAQRAATSYASLQTDAANARAAATTVHQRNDRLHNMIVTDAVRSYQTGQASDDVSTHDLVAAAESAEAAVTRADTRIDAIVAAQDRAKADVDRLSAQYAAAQQTLRNIDQQLDALGTQRSTALRAAKDAKSGDVARQRQSLVESGQLGAEIRTASARLAAAGRTVQGSGDFIPPSSGVITSPYGMRMHPILHYVKLHTGTDFAVGDGFAHAADAGRVLFTIVSQAYGNFTVIDHGTIDGRHITTAYAHQAKFLVKPGDVVAKGQTIGVIGATGYATGPHLHFEVRDDGAVENPMTWLAN